MEESQKNKPLIRDMGEKNEVKSDYSSTPGILHRVDVESDSRFSDFIREETAAKITPLPPVALTEVN